MWDKEYNLKAVHIPLTIAAYMRNKYCLFNIKLKISKLNFETRAFWSAQSLIASFLLKMLKHEIFGQLHAFLYAGQLYSNLLHNSCKYSLTF